MNPVIAPTSTAAPHAHDRSSVDRIMLHVCLGLTPVTLFGCYLYGWPALILWAITCLSAIVTELLCLTLLGKPLKRITDASAWLTGWLLALTLPPWAPWWIGVGGSFFAVAVGKHLYGGIGQNIFNPAMLARVALLVSFPVQMTTWVNVSTFASPLSPGLLQSLQIIFGHSTAPDGMTGATLLGELKTAYTAGVSTLEVTAQHFSLGQASLGFTRGSLGETSEVLVLLGATWLLMQRIISWHIPVSLLLTTAILAATFHEIDSVRYASPWVHLTSGGIMLGAFFIATDYVTSPTSHTGKILFGIGCALVLFAIRTWGGFPEGVGFAVLFMNALTPLIDRYCKPRAYGRDIRGKALKVNLAARKVDS